MAGWGDDRDRLLGVWRLVSAQIRFEDTGEVTDLHGPNPQGFAVFSPEGRVAIIFAAAGRKPPRTEVEAAALYGNMSAYTGRFSLAGNQVVIDVDVAWNPAWDGSRQLRFYELAGDRLTLKTAEVLEHPIQPGRPLRGVVVWQRES